MRIYLHGRDNLGWSIDQDRYNISVAAAQSGHRLTDRAWTARIVHSLWWNDYLRRPLRFWPVYTKLLFTCSNFVNPDTDTFILQEAWEKALRLKPFWVAPSLGQKRILEKLGQPCFHLPFFIDFNLFSAFTRNKDKAALLQKFNIPRELVAGRVLFASYQRDSLGSDLNSPKWQKNPDGLIRILQFLPKDKFLLLLAGPRRHYIIRQCEKFAIPYHYIGQKTSEDDITTNMLSHTIMPELYALADMYLVTSLSEGGPKAILESAAASLPCLSTNVGLAPDYLDKKLVFDDFDKYAGYLQALLSGEAPWPTRETALAFERCQSSQAKDNQAKSLNALYRAALK